MPQSRTIPLWVDRALDNQWMGWVSTHPLLPLILILSIGVMALGFAMRSSDRATPPPRTICFFWITGSLGITLMFCLHYLMFPKFADHGEAHIAALVAWFWRGGELYPTDGLRDYSNLYGPYAYVLTGIVTELGSKISGGHWIFTKLPGVLAGILGLSAIYAGLRRQEITRSSALLAVGLCGVISLSYLGVLYWGRPDPWVFLMAAIATTTALSMDAHSSLRSQVKYLLVIGACSGIIVAIKLHAGIYILPAAWVTYKKSGARGFLTLSAAAAISFLAPFFTPSANLAQHLSMLKYAAGQTWDWTGILTFFFPAVLALAFPLILSRVIKTFPTTAHAVESTPGLGRVTLLSLVFTSIMAAKPGAGFYQFFPMLPALTLAAAPWWRVLTASAAAWWISAMILLAWVPVMLPNQYVFFRQARGYAKEPVLPYIDQALSEFDPKTLAVGWGDNSTYDSLFLSFYRYRALRAGGPYYYDLSSRMESEFSGIPAPQGDLLALQECRVRTWLIPKDESPFGFLSWYSGKPIYPAEFRAIFSERYVRTKTIGPFDVWVCK